MVEIKCLDCKSDLQIVYVNNYLKLKCANCGSVYVLKQIYKPNIICQSINEYVEKKNQLKLEIISFINNNFEQKNFIFSYRNLRKSISKEPKRSIITFINHFLKKLEDFGYIELTDLNPKKKIYRILKKVNLEKDNYEEIARK